MAQQGSDGESAGAVTAGQGRRSPVVAVLGLGEAGSAIAADIVAAGARVRGYDPKVPTLETMTACVDEADAARGADLVLSVNSAHDAVDALRHGVDAMPPTAVWADLNTGSARLKEQLAEIAAAHGRSFADVALMAPVPGRGIRTPMLASGPGAARFADLCRPLGARVEVLDGPPGFAATRKLLRSVFYKGLAASVVEALAAARRAGQEEWLREHLEQELTEANAATVARLVDGTYRHARRRSDEMRAAAELLTDLGVANHVSRACAGLLTEIAEGRGLNR